MVKEIVSKKTIEDVAMLSRLEFETPEIESMQKDLSDIVEYFGILKEVDTRSVNELSTGQENILREDSVKESMNSVEVVKNAPDHNQNSFIVPRVVE